MALFRALESPSSPEHRLFTDVFAKGFLHTSLRLLVQLVRFRGLWVLVSLFLDWRWPGARTSGIARTCYIDDAYREAIASGFQQVVILGSGFDTRAYRLPEMQTIRVFEVDHPATLAVKQRSLLSSYLQQHDLVLLTDVGSVEYRTHYLGNTRRSLQGYTFDRIAQAEVRSRPGLNSATLCLCQCPDTTQ